MPRLMPRESQTPGLPDNFPGSAGDRAAAAGGGTRQDIPMDSGSAGCLAIITTRSRRELDQWGFWEVVMSIRRLVITIGWLLMTILYCAFYVARTLSLPKLEGYERDWQF